MFKPTLRIGSAGPAVRELQALLAARHRARRRPVSAVISPAHESAARSTIVNVALQHLEAFGSFETPASLLKPAIAGALCANPMTRARQGGVQLEAIFTAAGVNSASKCPTISVQAEQMYQRTYTAAERNVLDIPSWCGIFALSVLRASGLRLSDWPLRWSLGNVQAKDELRLLGATEPPLPGDIGIKLRHNGAVLNHHFVVVATGDDTVSSVDGNVGGRQEIQSRRYTRQEIRDSDGGFLRPLWDRVLTA